MKVGARTRLLLGLAVWAIIGVGLLAVPALISLFSPNPIAATQEITKSNGNTNALVPAGSFTQGSASPASSSEVWSLDSLFRLVIVLVVALSVSSLGMVRLRRSYRRSQVTPGYPKLSEK